MSSPMKMQSPAGGPGLAEKNKKGLRNPFLTEQARAVKAFVVLLTAHELLPAALAVLLLRVLLGAAQ